MHYLNKLVLINFVCIGINGLLHRLARIKFDQYDDEIEDVASKNLAKAVKINNRFRYPWYELRGYMSEFYENLNQIREVLFWKRNRIELNPIIDFEVLDQHLPIKMPYFVNKDINMDDYLVYTWLGHATGVLTLGKINIMMDPVLTSEISGAPEKFKHVVNRIRNNSFGDFGSRIRDSPVKYSDLPNIHLICISHNHNDHLSHNDIHELFDLDLKQTKNTYWLVPDGVGKYVKSVCLQHRSKSHCDQSVFEMTWGDKLYLNCKSEMDCTLSNDPMDPIDEALCITFIPSLHWSGKSLFFKDFNQSLWGGFHYKKNDHSALFTGDTAYFPDNFSEYKKVGELFGPIDLLIVPIGCYSHPEMELCYQHIDPYYAIKIFNEVKARFMVGIHWGTWILSGEHIIEPKLDLYITALDMNYSKQQRKHLINILLKKIYDKKPYLPLHDYPFIAKVDCNLDRSNNLLSNYANFRLQVLDSCKEQDFSNKTNEFACDILGRFNEHSLRIQTLPIGGSLAITKEPSVHKLVRFECNLLEKSGVNKNDNNCIHETLEFSPIFP